MSMGMFVEPLNWKVGREGTLPGCVADESTGKNYDYDKKVPIIMDTSKSYLLDTIIGNRGIVG